MVWNKGKKLHYQIWNKDKTSKTDTRIKNNLHSARTKEKMSQIAKKKRFGKWNLGRKFSEVHKTKISDKLKGKNTREQNGNWKDGRTKKRALEYKEKIAGKKKPILCEICNSSGTLCFDHNHKTDKFRGWICKRCNFALGLVKDNIETLQKMITYLSK